jgi:hypothetical protein
MANEPKTEPREAFLRIVAVLGLIVVLLLGAWGIITLAVNLPNILGALGGGIGSAVSPTQSQSLTVTAPATVASGASLEVSWANKNTSGQYSYSLSYSCASGVSLKAPVPTGAYQTVACDTPFNFVNATQKMSLIPSITSGSAQVTITVSATNLSTGAIEAQGSATTEVTGGASSAPAAAATSYASPSYYPAQKAAQTLYGYPDLAVTINAVTPNGSRENVTFTIQNVGTNVAPAGWTFSATLPVQGTYTYASQTQRALYPGDKIVYTLGFDRPYSYNNYNYQTGCSWSYSGNNNCNSGYYYNYNYQPTYQYAPNNPYTCNNYGPCNIPGYVNLYPYGSPYQYGCPPGYGCSVPTNLYNAYNGASIGTVTVTADPSGFVQDANRANNTATAQVY